MNKKKVYFSYFVLAAALFTLLNLPVSFTSWIRSIVTRVDHAPAKSFDCLEMRNKKLEVENALLREQVEYVRNWLKSEDYLDETVKRLELYSGQTSEGAYDFVQRRTDDLLRVLEREEQYLFARVIFREPTTWSSSVWIDRGNDDNRRFGRTIIAKNSPVVFGSVAIGVIEEVKEQRSRVRLITDASLAPSVRAVRFQQQDGPFLDALSRMQEMLSMRKDLVEKFPGLVRETEGALEQTKESIYGLFLAKGEIYGSSYPVWRSRSSVLKGVGFNYEFADDEGGAYGIHEKMETPLLKEGDLLVTTGLDGIFPAGLSVAHVTKIFPLKEGAFVYDLEAKSAAGDLNNLKFVQVLPAISSEGF